MVLLLPYRWGAWMSSRWFSRRDVPSVEVVPGIWIGRAPGRSDWSARKPAAILDLTAEFNASRAALESHYRSVVMLDLVEPSIEQLHRAVSALDQLRQHPPVLVHCALGYSRSALVVSAWLLKAGMAEAPELAVDQVRRARPRTILSQDHLDLLKRYHGDGG
jgi:protein-tyrosine phosphatase